MLVDENYNIKIGELKIIKRADEVVWTILGSCVSVVFHVRPDLALICHAQYPAPRLYRNKCSDSCPRPCFTELNEKEKFKYVTCSLEYMISYLKRNNIDLNKVHTSLFGGSSYFKSNEEKNNFGRNNVMKAKEILANHKIKINREVTGGDDGYTLWYFVKNNQVKYKRHKAKEVVII
jgi:chemotaxis receptor (MCP) glutamine deamidase CheD